MIIKLTYTNSLPVPVLLRSNQASGQPLVAGQSLEMTFVLEPTGTDDAVELVLVCEPGQ